MRAKLDNISSDKLSLIVLDLEQDVEITRLSTATFFWHAFYLYSTQVNFK